ncbi:MAG: Cof-type HAD-IIB family hydrolase, partial [Lachnospiraceae bacterium]|nr:Cof-type HAD-IIB family hydrolase [Lachnospiraceae bacterium]
MKIKLVASDMDGTLLDSNKQLPPNFMEWVRNHPDIKTVIASGRQYYTLVKDFVSIKDELIYVAENGGFVFEKDKIIYSNEMAKEDIRICLALIENMEGLTPIVCGAESAYMK